MEREPPPPPPERGRTREPPAPPPTPPLTPRQPPRLPTLYDIPARRPPMGQCDTRFQAGRPIGSLEGRYSWRRPGRVSAGPRRAALLSLVVVVKTRSVRGEGPGCNVPTANDGGHVTTARAGGGAAVTPGTCSLTGAGLTAARWPPARRTGWRGRARPRGLRLQGLAPALTLRAHRWPFLREKRAKPAFIPQMQPERHPGLPHAY